MFRCPEQYADFKFYYYYNRRFEGKEKKKTRKEGTVLEGFTCLKAVKLSFKLPRRAATYNLHGHGLVPFVDCDNFQRSKHLLNKQQVS